MEDVQVDFSTNKGDLDPGEKENINVVIVPESILQAIKNSSNLNLNVSDPISLTPNNHQKEEDNMGNLEGSNLPGNNLWMSFPGDSYCISCDNPSRERPSQGNVCGGTDEPELSDSSISCSCVETTASDHSLQGNMQDNGLVQLPLFQNCLLIPTFIPSDSLSTPADIPPLGKPLLLPNPPSTSYLTMRIQSVENEGDKSIYTLAPASCLDATSQMHTLSAMPANGHPVPKATSSETTRSYGILPSPIVSTTSSDLEQKKVKTADKGTYVDGGKPVYKCEIDDCKKVFKSALQLRKHKSTVHEKEKLYKCKYANCMWSFRTPYKLKRHLESHYKRKPYSCPFAGCGAVFSSDYNQKAHLKLHTTLNPERICKTCGQVMSSKRELSFHMRKVHEQQPGFTCNICHKNFHTPSALTMHKRSHNPQLEYDCPMCEKKFTKRYYLKIHLYTHTGERPYQCDQCDWGFASLSRLNRHMATHKEEKRFKCSHEKCKKEFNRLHHLVAHLRKIHGIHAWEDDNILQERLNEATGGEQPYFTCTACGFGFLSSHGLERHKLKCEEHLAATAASSSPLHDETGSSSNCVIVHIDNETNLCDLLQQQHSTSKSAAETVTSFLENITVQNSANKSNVGQDIITTTSSFSNGFKEIASGQDATMKLDNTCTVANVPVQIIDPESAMGDLDNSWSNTLLPSANLSSNTSHYLSCPTQEPESQVTLVPFIDDMSVLNDATTQQFLQLSDDITACVDSVSGAGRATDQTENDDVLQQYVVDSNGLGDIIEINDDLEMTEHSYGKHNSNNDKDVPSSGLFDDNIPLGSIEDPTRNISSSHFSGTTINLNDIH